MSKDVGRRLGRGFRETTGSQGIKTQGDPRALRTLRIFNHRLRRPVDCNGLNAGGEFVGSVREGE